MATVKQRESEFVPTRWRTCHLCGHAATTVLSLATTCAFYATVVRSDHQCYLYNAMLMMLDQSWETYEAQIKENVWYKSEICFDTFEYTMTTFFLSAVWMGMFEAFGRGGTVSPEYNQARFFSYMIEQWRVVIWACAFNSWCWVKSLLMAIWFTDGYWKFAQTVARIPEHDKFRNQFEDYAKLYYYLTMVLLWLTHLSCTFNFGLSLCRLASDADFEIVFDEEVQEHVAVVTIDLADSPGPSAEPAAETTRQPSAEDLSEDENPNDSYTDRNEAK